MKKLFQKHFANTFRLTLFCLRREWRYSIIWILSLCLASALAAGSYVSMFNDAEQLSSLVLLFENPAMIALFGPFYNMDTPTVGGMFAACMLVFTAIAVALMNVFVVVRLTRDDEEKGRTEVVRALPVGRLSAPLAAFIFSIVLNLVLALSLGAMLTLLVAELSFSGSILFGFCMLAVGIFFSALTLFACQVQSSSSGAVGVSLAAMGAFYIIRAAGAVLSNYLLYVSPLGIISVSSCYVDNNWLPVPITLALSLVVFVAALLLNAVRDFSQGILPQRAGRKEASRWLLSPFGLAVRLLRKSGVSWAVGLFIFGATYGSIMGELEQFIADNEYFSALLTPPEGYTQTDMFITIIVAILAVVCAVPSVGAVVRLANEERARRYENIYSKAVKRETVLLSYFIIAVIRSVLMLFMAFLGLFFASSITLSEATSFVSSLNMFMVYIPAVLLCVGVGTFAVGILPSKTPIIAYGFLGLCFIVVYFGSLLNLPDWLSYLTPFGYIPKIPLEKVNYLYLSLLTIVAAALSTFGFILITKRDT